MDIAGANVLMMGGRVMFGVIISVIVVGSVPVDIKNTVLFLFPEPIVAHVP